MSKIKYYAIKKGNGVTNKIVETWEECKVLVLGYPAIYKSFKTK
ncbi:RNase H1/viroplasmin domain-containing protein [Clostridium neonatale]|uniref:Ribonuclease HI-related protein n=3 Tax=root TaxID=1 RepID=A0AA86MDE9_9CLOT|nr:Ribonuclease HI-related protein [Clostridium neonatale]